MLAALNLRDCAMISATVHGVMSGITHLCLLHCKHAFDLELSFGIVHHLSLMSNHVKRDGHGSWDKALVSKYLSKEIHESLLELGHVSVIFVDFSLIFSFSFSLTHLHSSIFSLSTCLKSFLYHTRQERREMEA